MKNTSALKKEIIFRTQYRAFKELELILIGIIKEEVLSHCESTILQELCDILIIDDVQLYNIIMNYLQLNSIAIENCDKISISKFISIIKDGLQRNL